MVGVFVFIYFLIGYFILMLGFVDAGDVRSVKNCSNESRILGFSCIGVRSVLDYVNKKKWGYVYT